MSGLKILLLVSAQDDFQFFHYFPPSYEQPYKVNELILYTKFFKNCGKGALLSKDSIYYYKTYIPSMENNANKNKKNIFLFFYCDSNYQQKYIDEFTDNIFDLFELEQEVFEGNNMKKKISKKINELFDIYKSVNHKEEIYKEYINNIMQNAKEESIGSNNSSLDNEGSFPRKRVDSRISQKTTNSLMSIRGSNLLENIEMVKINEYDTDLTMIFKENKYDYYFKKIKRYKKIKIINIIIFTVLGIVMYCLIPVALKNNNRIS